MIKKIKSKLSVKVFLLTALLMVSCCAITYFCIAYFAPYIYTHELGCAEEIAYVLSDELSHAQVEEAQYYIQDYKKLIFDEYEDEFVLHLFQKSGEEVELPRIDTLTDKTIKDYEKIEKTKEYRVIFLDRTDEYRLLLARNTDKESQVIEALRKSLPVLCVVIFAVSVIAAFFYTWYLTRPINNISKLSERMADIDFNASYPTKRTDEIGILSHNLTGLSNRLAAALSELQTANQKLQADIDMERQLKRQRGEFFSAASHELKTPITIIKGQLQGMLYQVGRYKDRETYLAKSIEVTDTLEKMVQELLILSRLDAPGYVCRKSETDLTRLIKQRLIAYEDLFVQKELIVEQSLTPDISIMADIQLLQNVLDNLLGNAAVYSTAGNHIYVRLWSESEKVMLTIENTGVHIPDEDIPKLFEAFYRVDHSRNRQTGGTGLGLYIVKTILELHGAEIIIANSVQGVIVSIQF